jgi:hypothetical protein
MKKLVKLFALLLSIFLTSCGQHQTNLPIDNSKAETHDIVTSAQSNDPNVHTKYEYADSTGKHLIIENGFPRGGPYTDHNGKKYFKAIFWTRFSNETDKPLELKIDFPVASYEVPGLPGKYYQVLVPPDTMTIDKVLLNDYGLTGLKSFLDNNIQKQTSLKRRINSRESSGFFVVIVFDKGVGGPFRTGFSIKGQNLFYRISRMDDTPAHPLSDWEKDIDCGSVNLKNLVQQK